MEFSYGEVLDGIVIVTQLALFVLNLQVKLEITKLRSHIYEHFVTKEDWINFRKVTR